MKDRPLWRGARFYNAARLVIVMMRRGFATKRLQKMMVRIHDLQRALVKKLETTTLAYDRVLLNFDDHCELEFSFSCSSTPVKGNENRSWDDQLHFFLLRALPCVCATANEEQHESNIVISINDHHQQQQPQCSGFDESPKFAMDGFCSPQVDRKAEEFITAFYEQMRLQRQESYLQCQEMLARAT